MIASSALHSPALHSYGHKGGGQGGWLVGWVYKVSDWDTGDNIDCSHEQSMLVSLNHDDLLTLTKQF